MSNELVLLSSATNFAVVQLPGRQYPGVVFQGDTLFSIITVVSEIASLIDRDDKDELVVAVKDLHEQFRCALTRYEAVCKDRGIETPYHQSE